MSSSYSSSEECCWLPSGENSELSWVKVDPRALASELAALFKPSRVPGSRRMSVTESATWPQAPARVVNAPLISSSLGPCSSATFRYVDLSWSPSSPNRSVTSSQGSAGESVVGSVS